MSDLLRLTPDAVEMLCEAAARGAGIAPDAARSLAAAATGAEMRGLHTLGLAYLPTFLQAAAEGRLDGGARPEIRQATPALFTCDARGGIPHLGFDLALERLMRTARSLGMAAFLQKNAHTCGELGHFTLRVAEGGLIALAATNGPALLAGSGVTDAVFCTNPVSLAAPRADAAPLLIDQASSHQARAEIRRRAQSGEELPEGWALDPCGRPTTDPTAALEGVLLPFGEWRGANLALMVEILAALLPGARWSADTPRSAAPMRGEGTGLSVILLDPGAIDPSFPERLDRHLRRLAARGVHIPGERKARSAERARRHGLQVPRSLVHALEAWAAGRPQMEAR